MPADKWSKEMCTEQLRCVQTHRCGSRTFSLHHQLT